MGSGEELPSIFPLDLSLTNVYPAALKCALLSENLERRVQELTKRTSNSSESEYSSPNSCPPKYVDKLLDLVVRSLLRQMKEPQKYPHIFNFRQPAHQEFWDGLIRFSTYLKSIPKDKISQRVGNIEALVMIFSKYASQNQPVLNKRASLLQQGTASAESLNKFAAILRHILTTEFKVNPAYSTMLYRLNQCVRTSQDSGHAITGYSQSTVAHLQKLCPMSDQEHLKLVSNYKPICNGYSYFQDIKKCLTHLEKNADPYLAPEEYLSTDDFSNWKSQERTTLSQLITSLTLTNPDLVSDSMESNTFSPNDYRERPYIFIPNDPRGAYRVLVITATQKELVEADSSATGLSEVSQLLLKDCALRWRLTTTFKLIAHLETIAYFFGNGDLDFDALAESFIVLQKHIEQHPCETWAAADRKYLAAVFSFLLQVFLDVFCANLENLTRFPVPLGHMFLDTIEYLFESYVLKEVGVEPTAYTEDLANRIQAIFIQRYEQLNETAAPEAGESEALNLRLMAKLIMKDIRHAAQMFQKQLLGAIDAIAILVRFELKYFTLQAENMLNGRESELIPVEDALNFYNGVVELYDLAKTHVDDLEVGINLVHWFNRQFTKWLAALDGKSLGWVELAIKYDHFEPLSPSSLHSSSVDDLICGFREQLDFLDKLSWPNDLLESRSMAKVAKVIYESIELYATRIEKVFQSTKDPPPSGSPRKLKWDMLKFGNKKEEASGEITKEQCVVINNIFHLRRRVQDLFRNLDYQRYSSVLAEYIKEKEGDTTRTRMFYIKVVSAEFLKECDSGKDNDAYAVLSLGQETLFTTSIQWDNALPKWNETCGVALESAQDLKIRIFDKDLLTDDLCGEGILHLDPQDDWSSEDADIWLELEPQGRVLFSISTADEKDDPHYYVTKAIRILEMHEMDLLQCVLSNFTGAIKASLSRKNVFRDLHKRKSNGFRKFLGHSRMPSEVQFSDEDCDQALLSLAELFDSRLNLPFSFLYEACGCRLIISVWRECLLTIETAIVPSFSENRAIPKPLSKQDFDFLMRIVELLKIFFHGGEDADGLPIQMLEIPNYRLLHAIQKFYFSSTDELIHEYLEVYKTSATSSLRERSPTVYKADVILRLVRIKGDKHGLQFVESQLGIRSKSMSWARSKKKSSNRNSIVPTPRSPASIKP